MSVRWTFGKVSRRNPHVIASNTEGKWEPENGYDWINPDDKLNDKSVRWAPGTASNRYPNIVAAAIEGQWRPVDGYTWIVYPPRWADMRVVKPIEGPQDQYANPPPIPPFDQGLADRAEWEIWAAALSGDFRRGAEWWAAHCSLANPGACNGPAAAMDQQFILGCEAAKARLIPKDSKRKSDPDYRRGWNSYTGTTPDSQAPAVDQVGSAAPNDADADPVKKLNEQELKRLKGRKVSFGADRGDGPWHGRRPTSPSGI